MTDETAADAIAAAHELGGRVGENTQAVASLVAEFRTQQKWARRNFRWIRVGLVLLLTSSGVSGYALYKVQHDMSCISRWANESADRSRTLYEPTLQRDKALSHLIQLIPTDGSRADPTAGLKALITFDKLDDDLNTARADNPLPIPPEIHC